MPSKFDLSMRDRSSDKGTDFVAGDSRVETQVRRDWANNSNIIIFLYMAESQTIEDFGDTLHLDRSDLEHLRSVFLAVENGDIGKYYSKMLQIVSNNLIE